MRPDRRTSPQPAATDHRIPVGSEPAPIPVGAGLVPAREGASPSPTTVYLCPRPRRARAVGPRGAAIRQRSFGTSLLAILLLGIAAPALSADDPAATVDAFHAALAAGDRDAALALLAEDLTVFESGWAERTREEYAGHHLGADMEFSAATAREIVARSSGEAEDAAWVLTETRTTGTFRDREIASLGLETMVLRRTEGSWRIVHIHWSARDAE